MPAGDRTREGVVGDWSVQDMVWHCARWADYCGEHLELMRAGSVRDPFEAESDAYWDRMNQDIADARRRWRGTTSTAARPSGSRAGPDGHRGARATWTMSPRTWFAEETYVHYDEHAEHIAAFVDGLPG